MANSFAITLTSQEQAVLDELELDAMALVGRGPDFAKRNGRLAAELMRLLGNRPSAIPKHRVDYFTSPEFNTGGRGRSRQDVFEKNGTSGADILEHPHFLKYLEYFIFGPRLPERALTAFAETVEDLGPITSGDIQTLTKLSRALTRTHGLNSAGASDEFFKLALEHGLDPAYADIIRKAVRSVKA